MTALLIAVWGAAAGILHLAAMVILYANPWTANNHGNRYAAGTAQVENRHPRSLTLQLLGTQTEIYAMTIGFAWLHPLLPGNGLAGACALALMFAVLRTLAPVWALWLHGHSHRHLAIEAAAGALGSGVVVLALYVLTPW
ncbi:hypothetical protein [Nocardia tengchongensis]|uniref:hypothetical protein n=1 Tax=Nocardia tengchongensis TaxID=2055889 RepID=UPI00362121F7